MKGKIIYNTHKKIYIFLIKTKQVGIITYKNSSKTYKQNADKVYLVYEIFSLSPYTVNLEYDCD